MESKTSVRTSMLAPATQSVWSAESAKPRFFDHRAMNLEKIPRRS